MTYTTGRDTGMWAPTSATETTAQTRAKAPAETPGETGRTDGYGTGTTGTPTGSGGGVGGGLLPRDECERLALRMQQAVTGFVDGPRGAVQEADHVLEDIAARFTEAMTHRRRGLRDSWQPDGTASGPGTTGDAAGDTEQLRLALRDYRELAERLLRM